MNKDGRSTDSGSARTSDDGSESRVLKLGKTSGAITAVLTLIVLIAGHLAGLINWLGSDQERNPGGGGLTIGQLKQSDEIYLTAINRLGSVAVVDKVMIVHEFFQDSKACYSPSVIVEIGDNVGVASDVDIDDPDGQPLDLGYTDGQERSPVFKARGARVTASCSGGFSVVEIPTSIQIEAESSIGMAIRVPRTLNVRSISPFNAEDLFEKSDVKEDRLLFLDGKVEGEPTTYADVSVFLRTTDGGCNHYGVQSVDGSNFVEINENRADMGIAEGQSNLYIDRVCDDIDLDFVEMVAAAYSDDSHGGASALGGSTTICAEENIYRYKELSYAERTEGRVDAAVAYQEDSVKKINAIKSQLLRGCRAEWKLLAEAFVRNGLVYDRESDAMWVGFGSRSVVPDGLSGFYPRGDVLNFIQSYLHDENELLDDQELADVWSDYLSSSSKTS